MPTTIDAGRKRRNAPASFVCPGAQPDGSVVQCGYYRVLTDETTTSPPTNFGRKLALFVGIGLVVGAGAVAISGGDTAIVTIMALVGAASLSGWLRSRPPG